MKRVFNQALREYCRRDYYPWHMPGHKRRELTESSRLTLRCDVTEVPGLDNLNEPEGVLRESMAQLSEVYGSAQSYYLINGSSCGILAAISAVCQHGDTLIMGRNCHKAVYHAAALLELKPVYLWPDVIEPYGICGAISEKQVREALTAHPEAKAVIVTSPTYEGILSDIRAISRTVRALGSCLIVDEAHGAHLEFGTEFPEPAVRCGADIVIESLHKTLPCANQCAILHIGAVGSAEADRLARAVERYLKVYQTSSPSYLLVANMEDGIASMQEWRGSRMADYQERLARWRGAWRGLKGLHLLTEQEVREAGGYAYDPSKLVFGVPRTADIQTGEDAAQILEADYGMILEMASLHYILAMTSIADSEEGFQRLDAALRRLDARWAAEQSEPCAAWTTAERSAGNEYSEAEQMQKNGKEACGEASENRPELVLLPGKAWREETEQLPLTQAIGRIAGEYVTVYPPGIPILVPGERIEMRQAAYLQQCREAGLHISGLQAGNVRIIGSYDIVT